MLNFLSFGKKSIERNFYVRSSDFSILGQSTKRPYMMKRSIETGTPLNNSSAAAEYAKLGSPGGNDLLKYET